MIVHIKYTVDRRAEQCCMRESVQTTFCKLLTLERSVAAISSKRQQIIAKEKIIKCMRAVFCMEVGVGKVLNK